MVAEKAVLESLKNVMKLNSYEAKIYTALLSRGISSASELADISGVPRSRCYDVLESLEKKGFVFMKIGKPIRYIAISPKDAIETLKKAARIEESRIMALMDSFVEDDVFDELRQLYKAGVNYVDNTEISTSMVGRQNINSFLKEMLSRASSNITVHTTEESAKRKEKIIRKAVDKKVKVSINVHGNEKGKKMLKDLRMVMVDEDELLFFTSPEEADPEHESAVWVKSAFISDAVKKLIE
jgi:sugar-specific transcriptional regulator TrmB